MSIVYRVEGLPGVLILRNCFDVSEAERNRQLFDKVKISKNRKFLEEIQLSDDQLEMFNFLGGMIYYNLHQRLGISLPTSFLTSIEGISKYPRNPAHRKDLVLIYFGMDPQTIVISDITYSIRNGDIIYLPKSRKLNYSFKNPVAGAVLGYYFM